MRTFIIRLLEDRARRPNDAVPPPRLRGIVDEVATGLRAVFRNDHELVAALVAAVGPVHRVPWDSDRPLVNLHRTETKSDSRSNDMTRT